MTESSKKNDVEMMTSADGYASNVSHGSSITSNVPICPEQSKQAAIEQLCKMMGRVYSAIDPNADRPCDCVCRHAIGRYQNAGHVLEFMERVISEAIARHERAHCISDAKPRCTCSAHVDQHKTSCPYLQWLERTDRESPDEPPVSAEAEAMEKK